MGNELQDAVTLNTAKTLLMNTITTSKKIEEEAIINNMVIDVKNFICSLETVFRTISNFKDSYPELQRTCAIKTNLLLNKAIIANYHSVYVIDPIIRQAKLIEPITDLRIIKKSYLETLKSETFPNNVYYILTTVKDIASWLLTEIELTIPEVNIGNHTDPLVLTYDEGNGNDESISAKLKGGRYMPHKHTAEDNQLEDIKVKKFMKLDIDTLDGYSTAYQEMQSLQRDVQYSIQSLRFKGKKLSPADFNDEEELKINNALNILRSIYMKLDELRISIPQLDINLMIFEDTQSKLLMKAKESGMRLTNPHLDSHMLTELTLTTSKDKFIILVKLKKELNEIGNSDTQQILIDMLTRLAEVINNFTTGSKIDYSRSELTDRRNVIYYHGDKITNEMLKDSIMDIGSNAIIFSADESMKPQSHTESSHSGLFDEDVIPPERVGVDKMNYIPDIMNETGGMYPHTMPRVNIPAFYSTPSILIKKMLEKRKIDKEEILKTMKEVKIVIRENKITENFIVGPFETINLVVDILPPTLNDAVWLVSTDPTFEDETQLMPINKYNRNISNISFNFFTGDVRKIFYVKVKFIYNIGLETNFSDVFIVDRSSTLPQGYSDEWMRKRIEASAKNIDAQHLDYLNISPVPSKSFLSNSVSLFDEHIRPQTIEVLKELQANMENVKIGFDDKIILDTILGLRKLILDMSIIKEYSEIIKKLNGIIYVEYSSGRNDIGTINSAVWINLINAYKSYDSYDGDILRFCFAKWEFFIFLADSSDILDKITSDVIEFIDVIIGVVDPKASLKEKDKR